VIRIRLVPLAIIGMTTVALSACSVGGHATPDPSTGISPSSAASPSSSGPTNPFAGMNSCTVLDKALAGQGYSAGVPGDVDAKRSCDADKAGYGTVSVSLQDGQKPEENIADPSKASTGDVNGRSSIQIRAGIGAKGQCEIRMEVQPDSRALVLVTLRTGTTDEACQASNDIAPNVETQLPKNN
jgi:hypothetical protein